MKFLVYKKAMLRVVNEVNHLSVTAVHKQAKLGMRDTSRVF